MVKLLAALVASLIGFNTVLMSPAQAASAVLSHSTPIKNQ